MSNVSYTLTVDVVVPAWVVEYSNQEDAAELALAAIEASAEGGVGAGWTFNGKPSVEADTGNLVVPLIGNACGGNGDESQEVRATLNPYSSALDGVNGFDLLSDDAFQDAVNRLTLRNERVVEYRLAA